MPTPAGWTLIRSVDQGAQEIHIDTYYRVVDGSEPSSWTWQLGSPNGNVNARATAAIIAYRGISNTAPIGPTNAGCCTPGTNTTVGSINTQTTNNVVLEIFAEGQSNNIYSAPAGLTAVVNVTNADPAWGNHLMFGNLFMANVGATGDQTATNGKDTGSDAAQLIALQPSSSGPTIATYSSAGIFTWTAPAGVTNVTVEAWGGGGGGGGGSTNEGGGGGGGGAYSTSTVSVTPGIGYSMVVGFGGGIGAYGGASAGGTGGNGGDSSFGSSLVIAKSGNGGVGAQPWPAGAGGSGGAAGSSVGTTKYSGGSGNGGGQPWCGNGGGAGSSAGTAANGNNATGNGITGASAPTGGGAGGNASYSGSPTPVAGSAPGGGGGGGYGSCGGSSGAAGAAGAVGKVVISFISPTVTPTPTPTPIPTPTPTPTPTATPTPTPTPTPPLGTAKIAFSSNRDGNAQIYLMDTDGTNQVRLTNNGANDESPRWSPNDSRLVFQSDRDNPFSGAFDIYAMNANGSGQTRLTSDPNDDRNAVWSHDGTKIAFQSARNGVNYQLYVMNADGGGQVNIGNSNANDTQPAWSPDGSKIAFASDRDHSGANSIYVMNSNGTNQTRLTFSAATFTDEQPVWSPDGSKLVFTSTRDSTIDTWQETDDDGNVLTRSRVNINKEVYVMNADGSNQMRLTNQLGNDDSPAWSSDGMKLVFRSDRERDCCDPTAQVWMMNADGSNQFDLSNNGAGDYCPNWSH